MSRPLSLPHTFTVGNREYKLTNTALRDNHYGGYHQPRSFLRRFFSAPVSDQRGAFVGNTYDRHDNLSTWSTRLAGSKLRIGCRIFSATETEKIRRWALAAPTGKTAAAKRAKAKKSAKAPTRSTRRNTGGRR